MFHMWTYTALVNVNFKNKNSKDVNFEDRFSQGYEQGAVACF